MNIKNDYLTIEKLKKMATIRLLWNILDFFFLSIWGLTIIDLLKLADGNTYANLDDWIKTLMALAGLIYFLITIPHRIKIQKLDRKLKKEQIEKLEIENAKLKDK